MLQRLKVKKKALSSDSEDRTVSAGRCFSSARLPLVTWRYFVWFEEHIKGFNSCTLNSCWLTEEPWSVKVFWMTSTLIPCSFGNFISLRTCKGDALVQLVKQCVWEFRHPTSVWQSSWGLWCVVFSSSWILATRWHSIKQITRLLHKSGGWSADYWHMIWAIIYFTVK